MSNQTLFFFLCASSLMILVHGCTSNIDCISSGYLGCCLYNKCQYISYDDSCSNYHGAHCYGDSGCKSGCCLDSSCKAETDSRCIIAKNRCYGDWECDSNCCKKKQCQVNDTLCSTNNKSKFVCKQVFEKIIVRNQIV